ncbi:signal recognition particle-docking protein FtsY [Siccibacter turicensis]|uniref:signal recognition particle-docking protein FtsY n=1 Tax=Siccibacter turicensis TaxID=357233 RepID=UPI0010200820|nr:signal recognition particle-docking protein FtsY [Siccibacter turicensis]
MAKDKKRGLFSWLGLGQKDRAKDDDIDQQVEAQQTVTEEKTAPEQAAPVQEAEVTRVEAPNPEAFAEEIVSVTGHAAEQQAQHDTAAPEVIEPAVIEPAVIEPAAVEPEHETLPQQEEVAVTEPTPDEWLPEEDATTQEGALSDEELEALALAAGNDAEVDAPVEEQATIDAPVEEVVPAAAPEQEKPTKEGFFARLKRSLVKTKENLGSGFIGLFRGKKIDDDLFEELEEQLLIADVGVETTRKIITSLTESASRKQLRDAEALYGLLKEEMSDILAKVDAPLNIEGKTPFVILMVGVNGVGKTTTIGKLARQFEQQGKTVMLAAGDTFRAAAVEQLQVWGQRNNIPVIAQHTGADSASVIFDAIQAAKSRGVDVLIADTAGRLQNKAHLMEELKKIVRVMKKLDVDAPHEVMLTIDASTGQNAISQTKLFHEAVGLTGITLTKLDGTAKGGVIFSVADQFGIPIRYIGVGERIEDLRPFNADDFIEALFARED